MGFITDVIEEMISTYYTNNVAADENFLDHMYRIVSDHYHEENGGDCDGRGPGHDRDDDDHHHRLAAVERRVLKIILLKIDHHHSLALIGSYNYIRINDDMKIAKYHNVQLIPILINSKYNSFKSPGTTEEVLISARVVERAFPYT